LITPTFLWLLISHSSVIFPIYVGCKLDCNKWKTPLLVLIITTFFSCLYHWDDQDNFKGELIFLGTNHFVHQQMDFYGSYLSFFMIIFYSINLTNQANYFDFFLVLLNIISVFLSLINITWYAFTFIITFLLIFYLYLIDNLDIVCLILKTFVKNKFITFLTFSSLIIAMVMQYNLCQIHNNGFYYQLYHGFWHFFLFLSAGMCILIHKSLIKIIEEEQNNSQKILCFCV
jgi:hypothetical protein